MYTIFSLIVLCVLHFYNSKLKLKKEEIIHEIYKLENDINQYKKYIDDNVRTIEEIQYINSLEFCEDELAVLKEEYKTLKKYIKELKK